MPIYAAIKQAIADDTGLANTILHIHAGLLILLVMRLVTRRSLGTFIPFAAVLVLEVANEVMDRIDHGSWRWDDTTSDFINTLFWPLLLSLAVRLRPLQPSRSSEASASGEPEPNPHRDDA